MVGYTKGVYRVVYPGCVRRGIPRVLKGGSLRNEAGSEARLASRFTVGEHPASLKEAPGSLLRRE